MTDSKLSQFGIAAAIIVLMLLCILCGYLGGKGEGYARAEVEIARLELDTIRRLIAQAEHNGTVFEQVRAALDTTPELPAEDTAGQIHIGSVSPPIWLPANVVITTGGGAPELVLKADGTIWWDDRQISDDAELVFALRAIVDAWPEE